MLLYALVFFEGVCFKSVVVVFVDVGNQAFDYGLAECSGVFWCLSGSITPFQRNMEVLLMHLLLNG